MSSASPTLSPSDSASLAPRHVQVGPAKIFDGDLEAATSLCMDLIQAGVGARVATANLDFLALARHDHALRQHLDESTMVVADGAPVAWLARLVGASSARRVAGVDLLNALLHRSERLNSNLRIGIYGSTAEIAERAVSKLSKDFPSTEFVSTVHPPFGVTLGHNEERDLVMEMASARPQICLIALGCPRQEQLIARHSQLLPGSLWIGIGGTLDFYAGLRRRAPKWAQASGLEWIVRLAQEPRRLWRRYVLRDIPTLAWLIPVCLSARAKAPRLHR